jgi:hypothetical protein
MTPQPGKNEAQAAALALASGWSIRIAGNFKLDGIFSAENLTGSGAEIFCPRCVAEFE